MLPDLDSLIQQFGENPHQFVWILRRDCANQYLDLATQTDLWQRTLTDHPVSGFDHVDWQIWAISDNGDLFFSHVSNAVAIVNPRDGSVAFHSVTVEECLQSLPDLMPEVFT